MSSNQERSPDYGLLVLADAEALRDHLDALNEAGTDDRAAGMDALPWGWVPAHGAPPTRPSVVVVPPAAISVRAQRFAFGIGALLAVDLLARLIGWVFS